MPTAEIELYDPDREDRAAVARALAADRKLTLVAPYDDYAVMAGQGTLGLELGDQAGELDIVLVPVGGGGLLAGVGTALKAVMPGVGLIGVEPEGADDTLRSLRAGRRLSLLARPTTIADGLRTTVPGELTFPITRRLLDGVLTVSDADIASAMRFCFESLKVVVEPSGAVALAALISGTLRAPESRIGVVLSGGNVDPERSAELIAGVNDGPSFRPGSHTGISPSPVVDVQLTAKPDQSKPEPALAGLPWR